MNNIYTADHTGWRSSISINLAMLFCSRIGVLLTIFSHSVAAIYYRALRNEEYNGDNRHGNRGVAAIVVLPWNADHEPDVDRASRA